MEIVVIVILSILAVIFAILYVMKVRDLTNEEDNRCYYQNLARDNQRYYLNSDEQARSFENIIEILKLTDHTIESKIERIEKRATEIAIESKHSNLSRSDCLSKLRSALHPVNRTVFHENDSAAWWLKDEI